MNSPNTSPIPLVKGEALIPISLSYEPYNQSTAGAHRLVAINTSSGFILQRIRAVQVCKAQPCGCLGWENYTQEIDTRCDILPPVNGVGFPSERRMNEYATQGIYMHLNNNSTIRWDTAESERINFADGNVSLPKGSESDEAGTYQVKDVWCHKCLVHSPTRFYEPMKKGANSSQQFAFIPPLKDVGFPAHDVKPSQLIAELVKYSDEHTVLEGIGEMLDALIEKKNDDDE